MKPERANPFYFLLILVSLGFVITALAYAVVPWDRQPEWLRLNGWRILLVEVAAVIVLGLLSIGLDHFRTLRRPSKSETIQTAEREAGN